MDSGMRSFHVNRILSSETIIELDGTLFFLRNPSRRDRYFSDIIYGQTYSESLSEGVSDEEMLLCFLDENGFWTDQDESVMKGIQDDIEKLKVGLFESLFRSVEHEQTRELLNKAKIKYQEYFKKRHSYDHLACEGAAFGAKVRYLIGSSLYYENGKKYWKSTRYWNRPDAILNNIINKVNKLSLTDTDIRKLSRTDPWRSFWNSREDAGGGIFGVPAADLNDEQLNLISWSKLYDSVRQHSKPPEDRVVEDDDILDGWLILQRQGREKELVRNELEKKVNKYKDAHEVYVMANTREDAKKIDMLNNENAQMIKRKRFAQLRANKVMNEIDMFDTNQRIMAGFNTSRNK